MQTKSSVSIEIGVNNAQERFKTIRAMPFGVFPQRHPIFQRRFFDCELPKNLITLIGMYKEK